MTSFCYLKILLIQTLCLVTLLVTSYDNQNNSIQWMKWNANKIRSNRTSSALSDFLDNKLKLSNIEWNRCYQFPTRTKEKKLYFRFTSSLENIWISFDFYHIDVHEIVLTKTMTIWLAAYQNCVCLCICVGDALKVHFIIWTIDKHLQLKFISQLYRWFCLQFPFY